MKRDLDENKEKALEQRLPQKQIKSENYSRISPEVISENVDAVEEETRIISSQSSNTKYAVSSEVLSRASQNELIVDFTKEEDYEFTHPISISYFGEKFFVSFWQDVYVKACLLLFDDYPGVFYTLREKTSAGSEEYRIVFKEESPSNKSDLVKLGEELYIEIVRNTADLIRNIRLLLDCCRIDYENLIIFYEKDSESKTDTNNTGTPQKDSTEQIPPKKSYDSALIGKIISKERTKFAEYLQGNGFYKPTLRTVMLSIDRVSDYAIDHDFIDTSLYLIVDYRILEDIYNQLIKKQEFYELDLSKNKRLTIALRYLIAYRKDTDNLSEPHDYQSTLTASKLREEIKTHSPEPRKDIKPPAKEPEKDIESPIKKIVKDIKPVAKGFGKEIKSSAKEPGKDIRHQGCTEFKYWLMQSVPFGEVNGYAESIQRISDYLVENRLENRSVFSIRGIKRLESIQKRLISDKSYRMKFGVNTQRYDCVALNKYIEFRKGSSHSKIDRITQERFSSILRDNFENGFRPTSRIDSNRFKMYYLDTFDEELVKGEEDIVEILKQLGAEQDGRIFFREGTEQEDTLDDIQEDIAKAFNEGLSCIYLSELFTQYQVVLTSHLKVYNVDALKELLCSTSYGAYLSSKNYLYMKDRYPDAQKDIQRLMQRSATPLSYDEIYRQLRFIPMDIIKHTLVITSKMVNVAVETYFYAPNLPINATELKRIAELIHDQLQQKSFINDTELRELIQRYCPSVAINTEAFTTWGLRNALSVLLGDKFSFNGAIISEIGKEINMAQTFAEFCRSHESMSLDELRYFAKEMNTVIYWDAVYEEMIRVSQDSFVRKDRIQFDTIATDTILKDLINGEYLPLKNFSLFLHFPIISVKWNVFVLESYVANYSRDFLLVHASYTATDCCGAIVRKDSTIKDFKGLVTDVLAHSNEWRTKSDALALLVNKGYLQRRRYSEIDAAVREANQRRNSLST